MTTYTRLPQGAGQGRMHACLFTDRRLCLGRFQVERAATIVHGQRCSGLAGKHMSCLSFTGYVLTCTRLPSSWKGMSAWSCPVCNR